MKYPLLLAALLVFTPKAFAGELPPGLMFAGKPVHPVCIAMMDGGSERYDPVHLDSCMREGSKHREKLGTVKQSQKKDGIWYESDYAERGYSMYRYLGSAEDVMYVQLQYNGGGSGHFSSVIGAARRGNTLVLTKEIAAGDRCNGGIDSFAFVDGVLNYSMWLTPYDLVTLTEQDPNIEAYKTLEASASSCIGTADVTGDEVTGVTLNAEEAGYIVAEDRPGWTENFKSQSCFNRMLRERITKGQMHFSMEELAAFTAKFRAECLL